MPTGVREIWSNPSSLKKVFSDVTWVDANATASTAVVLLGHHYLPPETHRQGVSVSRSRSGCASVRVCVCV